jgi:hypothetical protein
MFLMMTKHLLGLLTASAFWATALSFAAERCSSETELGAIGEILVAVNACKEAFPELDSQIEQTIKPLRQSYPACFEQFNRPGMDRDLLEAAVAMGKATSVKTTKPSSA